MINCEPRIKRITIHFVYKSSVFSPKFTIKSWIIQNSMNWRDLELKVYSLFLLGKSPFVPVINYINSWIERRWTVYHLRVIYDLTFFTSWVQNKKRVGNYLDRTRCSFLDVLIINKKEYIEWRTESFGFTHYEKRETLILMGVLTVVSVPWSLWKVYWLTVS